MTETLYNALQWARFSAKTYKSSEELEIFYDVVGEDSKKELQEIEERELNRLKRRIIETCADKHEGVAKVVSGDATFYSYGAPIIEQAKIVEDRYRDRNFALAKKSDFLRGDSGDSDDVREAVDYLRQEEIVNPNKFFKSMLILHPKVRRIVGKWNGLFKDRVGVAIGTIVATSVTIGAIGYLHYGIGGGLVGYLGAGLFGTAATCSLSDLENEPFDRISKQRQNFEQALNSLDSEVRKHFPLDSELGVAGRTD